jgi:hypothetical protein
MPPELNLDAESDDGPKVVDKDPATCKFVPADQDAYSVLRAAMQTHLPWVHERMCAAQDPHAEHVQLMKHAESLLTANSGDAGAVVMMRSKAEKLRNAQDSELRDMVLQDLTMYVTLANSHKTHSKEVARHMHSNDIWMLGADLALLAKLVDLLLKIAGKVRGCGYIESELPSKAWHPQWAQCNRLRSLTRLHAHLSLHASLQPAQYHQVRSHAQAALKSNLSHTSCHVVLKLWI